VTKETEGGDWALVTEHSREMSNFQGGRRDVFVSFYCGQILGGTETSESNMGVKEKGPIRCGVFSGRERFPRGKSNEKGGTFAKGPLCYKT